MKYCLIVSILAASVVACASGPKPVAEPVGPNIAGLKTNDQILSQATAIDGHMHILPTKGSPRDMFLFPESFVRELSNYAKSGAGEGGSSFANKMLSGLCNGKDAKYTPKETIKLISVAPPKGVGLDSASRAQMEYIAAARKFVKQSFFMLGQANQFKSERSEFDDDLKNKKNMIADFYSLDDLTAAGIKSFYDQNKGGLALLVVADKKGNSTTYLVPNKFRKNKWQREARDVNGWVTNKDQLGSSTTEKIIRSEVDDGFSSVNSPGLANNNVGSMFLAIVRPWKSKEGKNIFPIDLFRYTDIGLMEGQLTMVIPPEVQTKYFQDENGSTVCGTSQFCGYDVGKKFSATKMIQDQKELWQKYVAAFTDVHESSADDGTISFDVSLKMDVLCQYGRAVSDLQSK